MHFVLAFLGQVSDPVPPRAVSLHEAVTVCWPKWALRVTVSAMLHGAEEQHQYWISQSRQRRWFCGDVAHADWTDKLDSHMKVKALEGLSDIFYVLHAGQVSLRVCARFPRPGPQVTVRGISPQPSAIKVAAFATPAVKVLTRVSLLIRLL